MPKFSLKLALIDYIPNAAFGASMILLGSAMPGGLAKVIFLIGAFVSLVSGIMKATWKLCIAAWKKDIARLNYKFFARLMAGFVLMLAGLALGLVCGDISFSLAAAAALSAPAVYFLAGAAICLALNFVYKKTKFVDDSERSNMKAELLNSLAQLLLLLAIIFAM